MSFTEQSAPELAQSIQLSLKNKLFTVPILEKLHDNSLGIKNFGIVLPDRIFRGSWPNDLNALKELGVTQIISLYAPTDTEEVELLQKVSKNASIAKILHTPVSIHTSVDFISAAETATAGEGPMYIHCRAGANRTSIASLVISLIEVQKTNRKLNQQSFEQLLAEAVKHGFDYDKQFHLHALEEVMDVCVSKNLFPNGFFR